MAGDPGLVNPRLLDDVTDLLLAPAKSLDDAPASRIGQSLEHVKLHIATYTPLCMFVQADSRRLRTLVPSAVDNRRPRVVAPHE